MAPPKLEISLHLLRKSVKSQIDTFSKIVVEIVSEI